MTIESGEGGVNAVLAFLLFVCVLSVAGFAVGIGWYAAKRLIERDEVRRR